MQSSTLLDLCGVPIYVVRQANSPRCCCRRAALPNINARLVVTPREGFANGCSS